MCLLVIASCLQYVSDFRRCAWFGQMRLISWWIKSVKTMFFEHWCDGENVCQKWWWRKYVKTIYFKHWCKDEKVCEKNKSLPIFCHVFACYCKLFLICSWFDETFLIWSGELDIMVNKISEDHAFQALVWWWKGQLKIESVCPFSAFLGLFLQVDLNTFLKCLMVSNWCTVVLYLVFGLQSWSWLVGIKKWWKCWSKSMVGVSECVFNNMVIWLPWEVCNAYVGSLSFVDRLRWDMIKVWVSCLLAR